MENTAVNLIVSCLKLQYCRIAPLRRAMCSAVHARSQCNAIGLLVAVALLLIVLAMAPSERCESVSTLIDPIGARPHSLAADTISSTPSSGSNNRQGVNGGDHTGSGTNGSSVIGKHHGTYTVRGTSSRIHPKQAKGAPSALQRLASRCGTTTPPWAPPAACRNSRPP